MTVPVSDKARILWAIDQLCAASHLTVDQFTAALTPRCDHPNARRSRRNVWAMVAAEAGVNPPTNRVRRQVLTHLTARSHAA